MNYLREKSNNPWSGGRLPEIPLLFLRAGTDLHLADSQTPNGNSAGAVPKSLNVIANIRRAITNLFYRT